jgi:hypothetical protein
MTTPNEDWLLLARTHGISVREVKDIVTARRNWTQTEAIERNASRARFETIKGEDDEEA